MHQRSDELMDRYIYILMVNNHGCKSKYYGQKNIFYTGQTNNIALRFIQHINGYNSRFLKKYFAEASKILVYIEHIYGSEYDTLIRESQIKKLSRESKKELINSKNNLLVGYKPISHLIIKDPYNVGEEILIRL
jgi:predicted GIY-YIG superfamily endonuclease